MTNPEQKEHAPINWTAVIMFAFTTLVTVTVVPWYGFTHGYETSAWVAFTALFFFTGMSITVGYHRLWSHNAFEAHPILRVWLALWGAAALENTILDWCSGHRNHHRYCDDVDKDPYAATRGFWFSHMGWMLREYPSSHSDFSNVKNLKTDPIVMWQYKYYAPIMLTMNIGVPVLLGLIFGDVWGMVLLAGFFRIVVSHHATFFINSIAHIWGAQPYTDENTARDNAFFALLTHGEGYHNYHHIFQTDYRNGIRWFHWDPTKWFIKACSWVGLTRNLRKVPDFKIRRAMVKMQFKRAQEKLAKAENSEKWTVLLEKEYEEFREMLNEWTELQAERLDETRKHLREKWAAAAIHTRFKELDYSLKMQSKRLQAIMAEARVA
ncbi:acyl-CoA desaturase [Thalassolituus sp.]|uniref:acyl-CoA desaturase n=1 Tax=Thalassolituus sp. TaxID=2030822 RepID=UPI002A80B6D8|nr:fatty acid desaturase [Thalassolituus sp.]|tara:strand:+ start:1338 stop:2477 length:1140 start_codon:yes stop_codon:yes gene_type:complete